ncbi:MAG: HAMP domain-containing histidine kinase [Ignavibacteriales bacterium]|jgi:two-component system, sensor histidine kinase and response regulator|nr:HAMP domain-containing histidine kinase [Ignavibacteriales bacterium]
MSNDKLSERDQFFSKLSHDLRGSFTSILGFSDILNDPNEKLTYEEITEYVSRIGSQTRESYELLLNFINWLKLDTYNYGLTKENLNLLDLILQTKNFYKRICIEKKIEIKTDISDTQSLLIDYEIANSIFNNIFLFLSRISKSNSVISIKSITTEFNDIAAIEFTTNFSEEDFSYLNNLKLEKLNSDVSFPIVFAIKFTELSGGDLNFFQDLDNTLKIVLHLPS